MIRPKKQRTAKPHRSRAKMPKAAGRSKPSADEATPAERSASLGFPVVGIGASAGGLDAFTELLRALPVRTGMAFVLVQHLDPTHRSMLTEILSSATRMPVAEVKPRMRVEPNHVYVIPPGKSMIISGGVLQLGARADSPGQFRPIDQFLRSLAQDQKHKAIGVILSGGATDGTLGLEEIKAEGGITFAQDASAQHESMPRSAIAAGCVDFELAPNAIASELARIARHPHIAPQRASNKEIRGEADLRKLLVLVRNSTGVDFTNYKLNTLQRRIARRMVLHKIDGHAEYARMLEGSPKELEALYQDILINVTRFFRDPESFEILKKKAFPKIAEKHAVGEPIRIWVLGCSTGEEAYSIAIAISEFLQSRGRPAPPVQIFASDLNGTLIDKARAGVYPKSIAQDVSPERLRRWFQDHDGAYRVIKPLRDMVVFARHNSLTDPPFSRMDLISCRNLLIYLEPVLQQRLVPVLHYALNAHGFLWLGGSESVGTSRNLFQVVDAKHKLYSRKAGRGSALGHLRLHRDSGEHRAVGAPQPSAATVAADIQKTADRLLLTRYAPAGVLITGEFDILQFRGDTGPYLAPAPGKASLSLLKMARDGLVVALRKVVAKAKRTHGPVREEGIRVRSNGGFRSVQLEVTPVVSNGEEFYVVAFEETGGQRRSAPMRKGARPKPNSDDREEVVKLKEDLVATRDYLESVIEQQEAANEELQSANEEVQSANEELQSINEELETSKEEIQSTSEELATVNDELNHRNVELSLTNNDLVNLIASTHLAIVIVGRDLRIRRFSPLAEKLFNMIAADLGRPVGDVSPRVGVADLEGMLSKVIEEARPVEQETQDARGHWYSLRIRPYRTADGKIDGAVMVLVDIDVLKQSESIMRRQAALLERAHEPILVWDLSGPITYWNSAAEEIYGYKRAEALGKLRSDLFATDVPTELLLSALQQHASWTGELTQRLRDGTHIVVECRMWLVRENGSDLVLETHHPITERKAMELALRTRANDLAQADVRRNEFLAMLAHELRNPLAPLSSALRVIKHEAVQSRLTGSALAIMDRQLRRMSRLLDDLTDASRVTHGKIALRTDEVELRSLLTSVLEDARSFLDERGQEVDATLGDKRLVIKGDATRLEQVFVNLLSNASKYSEPGSRIRLTLEGQSSGNAAVITVADQGIGIAEEDLERVFELFVQGDTSVRRTTGGLGIGLTLARMIVHMHQGSIEAHSAGRGRGSEFIVRLPLVSRSRARPVAIRPQRAPHAAARRRVLVVDDNLDAASSLGEVLRLHGHEVTVENSATAALETAAKMQPDAVVLDLGLPEIDGFTIARRMREMPGGGDRLLIALSGYGLDEHRRQTREAGFDHHLTKPADLELLLDLVAGDGSKSPAAR